MVDDLKLSRQTVRERCIRTLSRGGPRNPDVLLVQSDSGPVVVKDFAGRGRLVRIFAPWLLRRELRAYQHLADHPAVPRVLGVVDALAFALEYRPGEILSPRLAEVLPEGFIDDMREAVRGMHARGVVHLDLRHRSNTLLGERGQPVILDFASALCFQPGGLAARTLLPALAWIDRRAVTKWEGQLLHGKRR